MGNTLAIAVGGAGGAVLRYWMVLGVNHLLGRGFPYSILVVNVLGAFLLGLMHALGSHGIVMSPELRMGILMGALGAFTTFSAFSFDTLALLDQGRFVAAGINVAANVILCVGACWLGFRFSRGA